MKSLLLAFAFCLCSYGAHAATLTCLPLPDEAGSGILQVVEKGLLNDGNLTLVLDGKKGQSVTGALVADELLGEGARSLEPAIAEQSNIQATVFVLNGKTYLHVTQYASMDIPQTLECN